MSALSGFGVFLPCVGGLVTQGDAARAATDVMEPEQLSPLSVVALYLVVVLDVASRFDPLDARDSIQ